MSSIPVEWKYEGRFLKMGVKKYVLPGQTTVRVMLMKRGLVIELWNHWTCGKEWAWRASPRRYPRQSLITDRCKCIHSIIFSLKGNKACTIGKELSATCGQVLYWVSRRFNWCEWVQGRSGSSWTERGDWIYGKGNDRLWCSVASGVFRNRFWIHLFDSCSCFPP